MAQQRVRRESAGNGALEHLDFIDPLPRERALAEQVLVHIGHGRRIGVHAGMPGKDGRVAGPVRTGERYAHARLEDAVALHDATGALVEHGAVQRVRHRADECRRGVAGQHSIRVQRDDVADAGKPLGLPLDDRKCSLLGAQQVAVELHELAALALPAHPDSVGLIQAPRTVEQVERRARLLALGGVRRVERAHAVDGRGDDRVVTGLHLGGRVEKVAEEREADLRIAVREVLCLEMVERLLHRLRAAEQDGNDDDAAMLRRDAIREGHAREAVRRDEQRDELVDDGHGRIRCG